MVSGAGVELRPDLGKRALAARAAEIKLVIPPFEERTALPVDRETGPNRIGAIMMSEAMPLRDSPELFWRELVDSFFRDGVASPGLRAFLERLAKVGPEQLRERLDPEIAERDKNATTRFIVEAIRGAVADHALSLKEVKELRDLSRLLRVEEGEILRNHRSEVGRLLGEELERVLEDDHLDPREALHKVKLQELLGLGYDEFLQLTAPHTREILPRILHRLELEAVEHGEELALERFRYIATTMDALVDLHLVEGGVVDERGGYLYVLMNPAMPGLIKIGRTSRPAAARVAELSGATGVPVPFVLLYDVYVPDAIVGERLVHSMLQDRGARVADNREFFEVTGSDAVEILLQVRDHFESGSRTDEAIRD